MPNRLFIFTKYIPDFGQRGALIMDYRSLYTTAICLFNIAVQLSSHNLPKEIRVAFLLSGQICATLCSLVICGRFGNSPAMLGTMYSPFDSNIGDGFLIGLTLSIGQSGVP